MKKIILFITLVLSGIACFAQSDIDNIIKKGIEFHDKGQFDEAIKTYQQALAFNSNSSLANYEISLTYMSKKEYENALKYSSKVIELKGEHLLPAYIVKGSCLDYLGKTNESIKLFEKGIKKFGDHHLLYYNLGYNYFKLKNYKKAENAFIKAIQTNPDHASSHLLLGYVMKEQSKKVQSLLCLHHFLLLEPNSERATTAYKSLIGQINSSVKKDKENPEQVNIFINSNPDSEFGAAEVMLTMLEASKTTEKNKNKSESELFISNTESFFKVLGELKEKKNKGLWWDYYVPLFYKIAKSDHIGTYCYYISQSSIEASIKWLKKNDKKVEQMSKWLKEN